MNKLGLQTMQNEKSSSKQLFFSFCRVKGRTQPHPQSGSAPGSSLIVIKIEARTMHVRPTSFCLCVTGGGDSSHQDAAACCGSVCVGGGGGGLSAKRAKLHSLHVTSVLNLFWLVTQQGSGRASLYQPRGCPRTLPPFCE